MVVTISLVDQLVVIVNIVVSSDFSIRLDSDNDEVNDIGCVGSMEDLVMVN